jgi:hypothetical protein
VRKGQNTYTVGPQAPGQGSPPQNVPAMVATASTSKHQAEPDTTPAADTNIEEAVGLPKAKKRGVSAGRRAAATIDTPPDGTPATVDPPAAAVEVKGDEIAAMNTASKDSLGAQGVLIGEKCDLHAAGTREWLFAEIRAWIEDPVASRVYWLMGGAGTGKTVVSAMIVRHEDFVYSWSVTHACTTRHDTTHYNLTTTTTRQALLPP